MICKYIKLRSKMYSFDISKHHILKKGLMKYFKHLKHSKYPPFVPILSHEIYLGK